MARVSGSVRLSPALRERIRPGDTVFVLARAAQGPRMPLAVLRVQAAKWPLEFVLDDSLAMSPEFSLSRFEQVVIEARVSRSGEAMTQSGDLIGRSAPVYHRTSQLEIVIDQAQP